MFWKHRVDLRELIQTINKLSANNELEKRLPQIAEALAEKLEYASVFRKSAFPKKIRNVEDPSALQTVLEEIYAFADDEKVWLGVETERQPES